MEGKGSDAHTSLFLTGCQVPYQAEWSRRHVPARQPTAHFLTFPRVRFNLLKHFQSPSKRETEEEPRTSRDVEDLEGRTGTGTDQTRKARQSYTRLGGIRSDKFDFERAPPNVRRHAKVAELADALA